MIVPLFNTVEIGRWNSNGGRFGGWVHGVELLYKCKDKFLLHSQAEEVNKHYLKNFLLITK